MYYKINFGSIGRTIYLEKYISEKIGKLKEFNRKRGKLNFWVDRVNSIEGKGGPLYISKIKLVRPRKKSIYIKKKNSDMFESIHDVVISTRKTLRREKGKRLSDRKPTQFIDRSSLNETEQQQLSSEAI